ncbi:hypothetical protein HHI36_004316 [Cryptolaemus montrouzieri]|uniref:Endonuclease/exonuclease/phosphatase domain-containing protein n=1 Tax=Cryptolaemus montrouzieri TaxID=559131 RepID=A0ABD2NQT2_9CUCU
MNITLIYKSPGASVAYSVQNFQKLLKQIHVKEGMKMIVLGDFNIDVSKKAFYSERHLDMMRGMRLKQLVEDFTRITDRSKNTVDLVFSNILELKVAVLKEPKIADHSMDLKKLKTANIEERLKRRNWVFGCGTEVYTERMDDMVDEFYNNVESVIDEVAPLELSKMKNKNN